MSSQQRRRRQRVERRDRRDDHGQETACEAGETPARDTFASDADRVQPREGARGEELVRKEVPTNRVHGGYRGSATSGGRSLVVKLQPSKLAMRVRFPPPAL